MEKLCYEKNGNSMCSDIIYAYGFNTEFVQSKNEDFNKLICFIVKEENEEDYIEYYLNRNLSPNEVSWHNRFLGGTTFEMRLKTTPKGDTFSYRKNNIFIDFRRN